VRGPAPFQMERALPAHYAEEKAPPEDLRPTPGIEAAYQVVDELHEADMRRVYQHKRIREAQKRKRGR
jgi:hypothetical protein